jgi:hypothetical protein
MFDLTLFGYTLTSESSTRILHLLRQYQLITRVIVIKEALGRESAVKSANPHSARIFPGTIAEAGSLTVLARDGL